MAKEAFKQRLNSLLTDAQKELSGGKGSQGFLVEDGTILTVSIRGSEFRSAFKSATKKVLKGEGLSQYNRQVNTDDMWNQALKDSAPDIKNLQFDYWGKVEKKNAKRYMLSQSLFGKQLVLKPGAYENEISGAVISIDFVASNIDGSLQEVYATNAIRFVKDTIWNNWVDLARKKLGNNRFLNHADEKGKRFSRSTQNKDGIIRGTYSELITSGGVKAAHKESSTSGVKALESLRDSAAAIELDGVTFDVKDFADDFLSGLKITARDKRFKKKVDGVNLPGRNHLIEVRLARNTREKSDLQEIKKAGEVYLANWVSEQIKDGNFMTMDEETSKSFKQDLIDSAVLGVTENLKSRGTQTKVKKRIKATKTHKHDYSVSVGKGQGKPSKTKVKKMKLSGAALVAHASKQPRLQSGKKAGKKSLAQIKGYINRGLHNEIQRNMGRPALNYQTGQFARSAALTSLYRANKTIVGEYTYQLDPYQTFENTGERQWPLGYNPKPLIARSIRQLATKHTQTKFTLRRI